MDRTQKIAANSLLKALLRACPQLDQHATAEHHRSGAQLAVAGHYLPRVFFPTTAVISVIARLREGTMAEVQTVGHEGMVGLSAWLGTRRSFETAIVQAVGEIFVIPAKPFQAEIQRSGAAASNLLSHYTAYSLAYARQTCICNAHHSVRERVSRWLLSSVDRAGSSTLNMTQSTLAEMVGTRRQTTGEVLMELKRKGLVSLGRQRIQIEDVAALRKCTCECYQETAMCYRSLLGPLL